MEGGPETELDEMLREWERTVVRRGREEEAEEPTLSSRGRVGFVVVSLEAAAAELAAVEEELKFESLIVLRLLPVGRRSLSLG